MKPYHLDTNNNPVNLYQLDDGRYQMIEQGSISYLIIGYKYVLVSAELFELLKTLNIENISFKEARVWNRKTNEEFEYQQIIVNQHFMPDQINDINLGGLRFLLMSNQYLFVSPELRAVLEKSKFEFRFSEGLSHFA